MTDSNSAFLLLIASQMEATFNIVWTAYLALAALVVIGFIAVIIAEIIEVIKS